MTCWAVLVSKESASELFQPGVTLTTELLTKRACRVFLTFLYK
jgi:hypothetical protein